ncbi:MAG: hypothetical protein LBU90_03800 [Bacteroidales bacterium]|jgi:hypothetical protein|nr:hypothetical protein [Bacteroidales bacterium]
MEYKRKVEAYLRNMSSGQSVGIGSIAKDSVQFESTVIAILRENHAEFGWQFEIHHGNLRRITTLSWNDYLAQYKTYRQHCNNL